MKLLRFFKLSLPTLVTVSIGILITFGMFQACTGSSSTANAKPNFQYKEGTDPNVVAKIGDEVLTMDDLVGDKKLDYLDLKKKEYEFKMERLNALVRETLLQKEADTAKMPLEEFITKKVVKGEIKISDKEFDAFVKEKRIPEKQLTADIKDRIQKYLSEQKKDEKVQSYLAGLTKNKPIEVYFKKPKLSIPVEVGNAPVWGNEKAPVTIVEFSDFQCPFCSRAAATIDEVKKKYSGKVKVAFKHFPLSFHKEAGPAAEASLCVNDQGKDKFWKFHDAAFENQKDLTTEDLNKYAKQAGANMDKFKECFEGGKFKDAVKTDMEYGEKLGVKSTPTFFINGELLSGALPFEAFAEVIDEAIADSKKN